MIEIKIVLGELGAIFCGAVKWYLVVVMIGDRQTVSMLTGTLIASKKE